MYTTQQHMFKKNKKYSLSNCTWKWIGWMDGLQQNSYEKKNIYIKTTTHIGTPTQPTNTYILPIFLHISRQQKNIYYYALKEAQHQHSVKTCSLQEPTQP